VALGRYQIERLKKMLNSCNFIGNLGADPEIKTIQGSGNKVANLSIGVTEKWKTRNGERKEKTEWVRLNCFQEGLIGVIENYLKKGSKVYVSGKMATRSWDDQNGQKKYSTEINIDKLVMLDGKDNRDTSGGNYGAASGGEYVGDNGLRQGGSANFDDDVPFAPEWR
jgi:single-strand DNA-binding protein